MIEFHLSFDTSSLGELTRLAGFKTLLDPELSAALTQAGTTIAQAAIDNTWSVFTSPTGELASTIYPWLASPDQMEIRVGSPYGRRREEGFSGMTDSLGRYYPNDPAKPYLAPALEANVGTVTQDIQQAVDAVWMQIGA